MAQTRSFLFLERTRTSFQKHPFANLGRTRNNDKKRRALHDAVAVELDHVSWACDAMRDAWEAEMKEIHKGAKAVVSTKISD